MRCYKYIMYMLHVDEGQFLICSLGGGEAPMGMAKKPQILS